MKPRASLSLDLDNLWSYLKVHGDAAWSSYPTYLAHAVPRILDVLSLAGLRITVFVVGADAARAENREALRAIAGANHEIGNHSFNHEPWIASSSETEAYEELLRAHDAIFEATGREPRGFRGPGFACSEPLLSALARLNYAYDASRLPTFIGPLARWYYFRNSSLTAEQRQERRALFGAWHDVLAKNRPHVVRTSRGKLIEIPVTTMPGARVPIHFSYLHYISRRSRKAAERYFAGALSLCRLTGTPPSLLLHPLDVLGYDDAPELRFFPGMDAPGGEKVELTLGFLQMLKARYDVTPMEISACA
ncbi:MAG: polysaccharide deacetylase family protein [Candidatus Eremiobacteraeota bacterium]|nr:polysaccharide deacetylase family protein [Candidatus Eremiobacteraeota bacterium]